MSPQEPSRQDQPPGYTGGGPISSFWWRIVRRVLTRRCSVCNGSGVDPDGQPALASGREPRCPQCFGYGRMAFP